jgi:hypothetical protein
MSIELWPTDGRFLSADEVVDRLSRTFEVDADREAGRHATERELRFVRQLAKSGAVPEAAIAALEKNSATSVAVRVEGASGVAVDFVVRDGEKLFFGFDGREEEDEQRPLIVQIGAVLGYSCEEV